MKIFKKEKTRIKIPGYGWVTLGQEIIPTVSDSVKETDIEKMKEASKVGAF